MIAALFTKISSLPNFASTCWMPAFTCTASATSIGTANASPPAASISVTSDASLSTLRAAHRDLSARLGKRERCDEADPLRCAGDKSYFFFE